MSPRLLTHSHTHTYPYHTHTRTHTHALKLRLHLSPVSALWTRPAQLTSRLSSSGIRKICVMLPQFCALGSLSSSPTVSEHRFLWG